MVSGTVLARNFAWLDGLDQIGEFEKIPGTGPRRFCTTCGSALPAATTHARLVGIPLGGLDESPDLVVDRVLGSLPAWATVFEVLPAEQGLPDSYVIDQWIALGQRFESALASGDDAACEDIAEFADIVRSEPGFTTWFDRCRERLPAAVRRLFDRSG